MPPSPTGLSAGERLLPGSAQWAATTHGLPPALPWGAPHTPPSPRQPPGAAPHLATPNKTNTGPMAWLVSLLLLSLVSSPSSPPLLPVPSPWLQLAMAVLLSRAPDEEFESAHPPPLPLPRHLHPLRTIHPISAPAFPTQTSSTPHPPLLPCLPPRGQLQRRPSRTLQARKTRRPAEARPSAGWASHLRHSHARLAWPLSKARSRRHTRPWPWTRFPPRPARYSG